MKNIINSERMRKNNPMFNKKSRDSMVKSLKERRRDIDIKKLEFIKNNITEEQEQIILASIIADGRLDRIGTKNANFILYHCYKQKDYLFWKADKLVNIFGKYKIYQYKNKNLIQIRFPSNPYFTELHSLIHENGKKRNIPDAIIKKLKELGILILYFDDGSNHPSGYIFSKQNKIDRDKIRKLLKKYGIISSSLEKIIYIKKSEAFKLTKILNKFNTPECMKYKIKGN